MPQTNQKLADIFQQMADILQLLDADGFRVNAFARIARTLGEMTDDVAAIGPDVKALAKLPGVGKGSAERIAEYLETGTIKDHQELLAKVPPGLLPLLDIPGLGPKTIALFWKHAGIESLDDLKARLESDALAELPGMGAKKLENLRKSIAFAQTAGQRVRIGVAMPVAEWFVEQLTTLKQVKQAAYAGSLRRGRDTIGDVDLLVAAAKKDARPISDAFVKLGPVAEVLAKGETKTSIRTSAQTAGGIQADLRIVAPDQFGAALLYFTGSKEHNVLLRERAIRKGMKLNEYALAKGDKVVAGKSEEDIYQALGLAWIPPELREGREELDLAEKGKLPALLELGDIQAELHAHTTASDGVWTIEELALAAAARGFHTVAVTDHSKGQAQANGLDEKRLIKHMEEVRRVAKQLEGTITVLTGTEVDILASGKLDYPDELLAELDVVVASPHAALSQEPKVATRRLIQAIENPQVDILGHPTGRLIGRREGLSPDMAAVIHAAAATHTALEINANHWRLDLRDAHARAAIEAGVKLSINTDAHGQADLDQLRYGVLTARRAGATQADAINCLSKSALKKWLERT